MISIKKIFFVIVIFSFFSTECNAVIKDSIFATVGNKAIVQSDITNEIKTLLILSGQSYREEEKGKIQTAAIQSIIKRTIKQIEVEKYKTLKFNKFDLENELQHLASNLNMSIDIFEKAFESNGVKFSSLIKRLETELKWNTLIFELYKNRLSINIEEIEDQLKLMQNRKKTYEYLISEIIIRPVTTEKLKSKIEEIKKKIEIEGFEKVAMDLSIAETALKGGNLGWVNENVLTKKFKSIIINTPVGKISEPVLLPQGILLFKVRNKKLLEESQTLEETKNKIVDAEKTKILNMFSLSHYDKLRRTISINYY